MRSRLRSFPVLALLAALQGLASCGDDDSSGSGGAGGSSPNGAGGAGGVPSNGGLPNMSAGAGTESGGASAGQSSGPAGGAAGELNPPSAGGDAGAGGATPLPIKPVTALVVLEGLRADLLSQANMPYLWSLSRQGVRFTQHHAPLPSNRMASAGTLATGASPAKHGVLGSRMYFPAASARDASGRSVDFSQPVDIEDRGILEGLQASLPNGLLRVPTFLDVAARYGLRSVVIGRVGPASLFDLPRRGWSLDDHYAWPRSFADWLDVTGAANGAGLPLRIDNLFPDLLPLQSPFVARLETELLAAPVVTQDNWLNSFKPLPIAVPFVDPTRIRRHSVFDNAENTEQLALEHLLGEARLDVVVLWLREPGESAERYGAGSPAALDALLRADRRFHDFASLLPSGSNLIVTSDGGASTLAGDARFFPRCAASLPVAGADAPGWVPLEVPGGLAVDGAVRLVELLGKAGFAAYDGVACTSGHAYSTHPLTRSDDWPNLCQAPTNPKNGELTGPAFVPGELDASAVVVASNGGSELLYVPSHDGATVSSLVRFLEGRPEIGSVFVSPRYAGVAGAFDAGVLGFDEDSAPDVLLTYAWDAADVVGNDPFVNVGRPPSTWTRLGEDCSTKACRGGLYCQMGGNPPRPCRFCPSDRPATDATCSVPSAELSAARAASVYMPEGELCETSAVCQSPLECSFGRCRALASFPVRDPQAPSFATVAGSSYAAMSSVLVDRDPSSTATIVRLVHDTSGVRGGSAPAELSAVLVMQGPAFRSGVVIDTPSGLADVAPTLLHALQPGLESQLGAAEGRLLIEALVDQTGKPSVTRESDVAKATGVDFYAPTALVSNAATLITNGDYTNTLSTASVRQRNQTYRYVVSAGAQRSGLTCTQPSDCASSVCGKKGVCLAASCSDGVENGFETGVDCGGSTCKACANVTCAAPSECASGKCTSGKCQAPSCSDLVKNGDESGVDCGGSCPACVAGKACRTDADCASGRCGIELSSRVCR